MRVDALATTSGPGSGLSDKGLKPGQRIGLQPVTHDDCRVYRVVGTGCNVQNEARTGNGYGLVRCLVSAILAWISPVAGGPAPTTRRRSPAGGRERVDGGSRRRSQWGLAQYVEVSAHLKLVKPETATLVKLAKDFRNHIHSGRAARLQQKCDRSTALAAPAAVEAVARGLTP
jgi:hypothetical protein